jgi:hypothetical protein
MNKNKIIGWCAEKLTNLTLCADFSGISDYSLQQTLTVQAHCYIVRRIRGQRFTRDYSPEGYKLHCPAIPSHRDRFCRQSIAESHSILLSRIRRD